MTARNNAAVLDLGTARFKLNVARLVDGETSFKGYKEDVGLGSFISPSGHLSEDGIAAAVAACKKLVQVCVDNDCSALLTVATEAFRVAKNSDDLIQALASVVGEVNILSPELEASIYFNGVLSQAKHCGLSAQDVVALDVGGGSLQAIWGAAKDEMISVPTGTFKLESVFQANGENSWDVLKTMKAHVDKQIEAAVPHGLKRKSIIFGSNCMTDFLTSAFEAAHLPINLLECAGSSRMAQCTLDSLQALYEAIGGRDYDSLKGYYPTNPFFMRGADKALLNVLSIASLIEAQEIFATNESLSSSLARLAIAQESSATHFGLRIHSLK